MNLAIYPYAPKRARVMLSSITPNESWIRKDSGYEVRVEHNALVFTPNPLGRVQLRDSGRYDGLVPYDLPKLPATKVADEGSNLRPALSVSSYEDGRFAIDLPVYTSDPGRYDESKEKEVANVKSSSHVEGYRKSLEDRERVVHPRRRAKTAYTFKDLKTAVEKVRVISKALGIPVTIDSNGNFVIPL